MAEMSIPAMGFRYIVSVTGNPASKIHVEVAAPVLQVVGDGYGDFHWADGALCGSSSTAGYGDIQKSDNRPLCKGCVSRWHRLQALYDEHCLAIETEDTR